MKLAGDKKDDGKMEGGRRVRPRVADDDREMDKDIEMDDLRKNMEMLTANVGTGQYAQSIRSALSMSSTTNARDIANLQAAVTKNYEIPPDSKYITLPKECMQVFAEHCKNEGEKQNIQATPRTMP